MIYQSYIRAILSNLQHKVFSFIHLFPMICLI